MSDSTDKFLNKRIAFVSTMMPTPTNVGGPSSLPFQLIAHRPKGLVIDIYTFNNNGIQGQYILDYSEKMKSRIRVISASRKFWICQLKGIRWLLCRLIRKPFQTLITLPEVLIKDINNNYDAVWIYPHYLLGIANQLNLPLVVTGPDSSVLHYERCMRDRFISNSNKLDETGKLLMRAKALETAWAGMHNVQLHFVGEADCRCFLRNNPNGKAFFLRHPSNMPKFKCSTQYDNIIGGKLRVIISGNLNVYTLSDTDIICRELCKNAQSLSKKFYFTFVGKGWEDVASTLRLNAFEVTVKKWVNDYFDELAQHDLQLFPISVGPGTKGKPICFRKYTIGARRVCLLLY